MPIKEKSMTEKESFESILTSLLKEWSERFRYPIVSTLIGVICISNFPAVIDIAFGDRSSAYKNLKSDLSSNVLEYLIISFAWIFIAPWLNYGIEICRHKFTLNPVRSGYKKLTEDLNIAIKTAVPNNDYSNKISVQDNEIIELKKEIELLKGNIEEYKQMMNGDDCNVYSGVLRKLFSINPYGNELQNYFDLIDIKSIMDKISGKYRLLSKKEIDHVFSVCRSALERIKYAIPDDYEGINIAHVLTHNNFKYKKNDDLQDYLFAEGDVMTVNTILGFAHSVLAVNVFSIKVTVFLKNNGTNY
jgi:hypothetical protein